MTSSVLTAMSLVFFATSLIIEGWWYNYPHAIYFLLMSVFFYQMAKDAK